MIEKSPSREHVSRLLGRLRLSAPAIVAIAGDAAVLRRSNSGGEHLPILTSLSSSDDEDRLNVRPLRLPRPRSRSLRHHPIQGCVEDHGGGVLGTSHECCGGVAVGIRVLRLGISDGAGEIPFNSSSF